jgi:hypothetical protein
MAFPDKVAIWVAWMRANRPKVMLYTRGLQILTGLILLCLGWAMGHVHFQLIHDGSRTQGKIVDSKQKHFRRYSSTANLAYMPIVEFQSVGQAIRFEDWLGSGSSPVLNKTVPVLYDAANPSIAMTDRPVMNWIPWAPTFGVGLLLLLAGVSGMLKGVSQD